MADKEVWQVLVVDDEDETCRQIKEHYDGWKYGGNRLRVEALTDFTQAMDRIEKQRFDLLVLDVFKGPRIETGEKAGIDVLEQIKARRFMPVIFYTALPTSIRDIQNPLVKVAEKSGEAFSSLDQKVKEYLEIPLMRIIRELNRHVDETIRSYLWDFVPGHWDEFLKSEDDAALAYLLCRRLADSLDINGADRLASRLKPKIPRRATTAQCVAEQRAHPLRYYIMPPSQGGCRTGDIIMTTAQLKSGSYCLVLTPWCDLIEHSGKPKKAEYVLLVRCLLLKDFPEYHEWIQKDSPSKAETERLEDLIGTPDKEPRGRQRGRYFFLPGVLGLPDLVIDFQQAYTEKIDQLSNYKRIATLDSPFCESVVACFTRFLGRIGTPDLDIETVIENLRAKRKS
jgi:CheY-like chemotaxis protein